MRDEASKTVGSESKRPGSPGILVSLFAYNEGERLARTLDKFPARRGYDVLIVDDGSSDGSLECAENRGFTVVRNGRNEGLGASIKKAFRYAIEHHYDVIVIMAGNGKDDPVEIERLLEPILSGGFDFVQGSRFLKGGAYGNMPFHRSLATRYIHPLVFSVLSGRRVTESTNGFRAFKTALLLDERIDWEQQWLDQYELEQYLHFKVVRLGYKRTEVPVSKIYPVRGRGYTKVKAFTGWWSMVKPLVYLAAGIKK
ncbi:MAG TPA: glycosyltransferase family 2 protein [Blastocatellia bacterium]|jgi:dolichol-phosphate mannosyltransferase|nr:glycosyltransferase family 2 protein [Blastocatellia bacterium]